MEPSRILPDLQSSLLCEQVRQESNGNLFIIGVIGIVAVPKFPIKAAQLCVFNRWTAGVGVFTETVRFLGPDQTTVLRTKEARFKLQEAAHHVSNVTVFGQLEFPQPGIYHIEVQVDQVMKIRYPVPVLQRKSPEQAQSSDPESTSSEDSTEDSGPSAEDQGTSN